MLWEFKDGDGVRGAAVRDGKVLWGDFSPFQSLYCFDAARGEELWRFEATNGITAAPVIDSNGVVYFNEQQRIVYARRLEDGSEVWTTRLGDPSFASPSLYSDTLLFPSEGSDLVLLDALDGSRQWTFATSRELFGYPAIEDDRAIVGSTGSTVYCVDVNSGDELWSFPTNKSVRGAVAIGHAGTVYTGTTGGASVARIYAISSEGQELWRHAPGANVFNAPVVDGEGVIYFSLILSSPRKGWVLALRDDGSVLWKKEMPDQVAASPMLAPDGTLYVVCRDKKLYAFRDPAGDLDHDGDVDLDDLATLGDCMTGPRIWGDDALTPPGCELLDFDRDWDVDIADFAQMQIEITKKP